MPFSCKRRSYHIITKRFFTALTVILILFIGFSLTTCDIAITPSGIKPERGENKTPVISDFTISGTGDITQDGSPKTVAISAKEGKTSGAITVKYNGSTAAPSAAGEYLVLFDVAAAPGWNAANELSAGILNILSAPPVYTYSFSASALASFGTLQTPYSQPASKTVTITSTGTGAVTLNQPTAANFIVGTLSTTSLATKGATSVFTVQPKAGLAAGTYTETISISGSNGTSAAVNANFTVTSGVTNPDRKVKPLRLSQKASPTNIVFLGDGFNLADNAEGGLFDTKVADLSNYFFSIQPYSGYEDYFSVYSVYAVSTDRGAKKNPTDTVPNTVFNSTFNYQGIDRLLVARNSAKIREYARLATPDPHLIIVIVNDDKYGGSGGEFAVTSINQSAKEITIHEIGHIFSLADEYVDEEYRIAAGITIEQAKSQPNVDVTSDLSKIKWSHFVGRSGYNDTAWLGGFYFASGVWRPAEYSIMRSYTLMQYNAISRETIVKKIMGNAGEKYSLDDFLLRDIRPVFPQRVAMSGSNNPMPVPVEVYAKSLYGDQKIRARFIGEED